MTDSETVVLRKELCKALGKMEEQEKRITEQDKLIAEMGDENAMLKSRLAYYESSNMSSSTTSLYNSKRKKFRKRRGEKISGGPGEKVEVDDGDGDGGDGDENKGKRGPPVGHAGASHHNAATHDTVRYMVNRNGACATEGCRWDGALEHLRYTSKLIAELDDTFHWIFFMARIEVCECPGCGSTVMADTPFLGGTCYGPTALAVIMNDVENNSTDRQIARRLGDTFGHYVSENSIWNARKAVEAGLKPAVIPRIKEEIAGRPWVQMDETKFKRGDGKYGYVWVACTPEAVFVLFSPHRSAAVLLEHFGWLRGRALISDGYAAYPVLFDDIQRCMVHPLRRAEELAVVRGGIYEGLYDQFLAFYRDLSRLESRAPLYRDGISSPPSGRRYIISGREDEDAPAQPDAQHAHVPAVVSGHAHTQQRCRARDTRRHHPAAQLQAQADDVRGPGRLLHAHHVLPYLRQAGHILREGPPGVHS